MNKALILLLLSLLFACAKRNGPVGGHGESSARRNRSFFEEVGAVHPYRENGPFSEELGPCLYGDTSEKSCTIGDLPLIGMDGEVSIDEILNRTAVSHDFLGEVFEGFLRRTNNKDLLEMFGSVNVIVISDKINPSFYWRLTGAIYLSARYFWLTPEHRARIGHRRDFRSAFGNKLMFDFASKYVLNGRDIQEGSRKVLRTIEDIKLPLLRLLFHELAHANDYFPKRSYANFSGEDLVKTYDEISFERFKNFDLLSDNTPTSLTSRILKSLGQVLFKGKNPSEEEYKMTADEVADLFKSDVAADDYSYSTSREDFAMLMQDFLLLYHYKVEKYFGVISYPESNFYPPKGYPFPLAWAQKNRILSSGVYERAEYGAQGIFENFDNLEARSKVEVFEVKEIPSKTSWKDVLEF